MVGELQPSCEFLTMSQAARRINDTIDPSTVFRWGRRGVLAADGVRVHLKLSRVGRRVFVRLEDLDRFIERLSAADAAVNHAEGHRRACAQAEARAGLAEAGIG